jgi:hypothetical protein
MAATATYEDNLWSQLDTQHVNTQQVNTQQFDTHNLDTCDRQQKRQKAATDWWTPT